MARRSPRSYPPPGDAGPGATDLKPTRTRASTAWLSLSVAIALLVVVLVFIVQNHHSVNVDFLVWSWRLPLAVDLLLAAVLGALVIFTVGAVRIAQLRLLVHRHAAHHTTQTQTVPSPGPTEAEPPAV